ncbi:MAG: FAD-linked oxidase C-terminal domain-containing protein, partial [Solirubrobacterales bacterium]
QVGLDALGATKRSFDPAGIMNPGCLLPTSFHRTP